MTAEEEILLSALSAAETAYATYQPRLAVCWSCYLDAGHWIYLDLPSHLDAILLDEVAARAVKVGRAWEAIAQHIRVHGDLETETGTWTLDAEDNAAFVVRPRRAGRWLSAN